MSKVQLSIGYYGHPGQQRELNEDSFLVLTPPALSSDIDALLVVADGMGGHQAGEVASQSLVELLDGLFRSQDYRSMVAYNARHEDYYVVVLKEVLEWANERLYQMAASRAEFNGMGTTITVVLIAQGKCFWGHVGDSRAYLLHEHQLHQLTMDHTWVNEQVSAGLLSHEEASVHPRRNVLTRVLAGGSLVRVDRDMFTLVAGDRLLLCSDGLSGVIQGAEIQEVLATESDPQQACDRLGALANQRGGPDNITVLTAYVVNEGVSLRAISEGRVLGPLPEFRVAASNSAPTSENTTPVTKVKSNQAWSRFKLYLTLSGKLLIGSMLSGLGMLLLDQINIPKPLSLTVGAIVIFSWGALLGKLSSFRD